MTLPPARLRPDSPLIFIAEDEADILELVITRLEQAGYRTCYAKNGWEAIDGIRRYTPDAVLLDINMGGMDGFAVLKNMKSHPQTTKIPVLMLTARGTPEDVDKAITLGAHDYLTKPFQDHVLLQRVARLIRRRATPEPSDPGPAGPDDAVMI